MSIRTEVKGATYWITFNNPKRSNAISFEMYGQLCSAMDEANANEDTLITVITGEGDYYSSGNDFSRQEMAKHGDTSNPDYESRQSRWIRRMINHRKILIGLVNGPVIGLACTTLGLFDYVICSDSAYFLCPFTSMGVSAEGTSSAKFPRIMGTSNANELLLFNEKMTAQQALDRGYVSRIFPNAEFREKAAAIVEKYAKLPKHSVLASKELIRGQKWRREMLSVHNEETTLLRKLLVDERTVELITSKFGKPKL